jgi:hypothetical protein
MAHFQDFSEEKTVLKRSWIQLKQRVTEYKEQIGTLLALDSTYTLEIITKEREDLALQLRVEREQNVHTTQQLEDLQKLVVKKDQQIEQLKWYQTNYQSLETQFLGKSHHD